MAPKSRPNRRAEKKAKKRQDQQEKAKAALTPCDIEWRTETQRRAWKTLNENDITSRPGSTLEEIVNNIDGQLLNENEALELINQEDWI